jgi:LPS export ABC transporter protein LptC
MSRSAIVVILLIGVALWAWLAPRGVAPQLGETTADVTPPASGYVATDAELIETDDDGTLLLRLRADRIAQPNPAADVGLTRPQLDYQRDPSSNWTLRAAEGSLANNRQQVKFSGAVQATHRRTGEPTIVIRTDQLSFDIPRQRADTAATVAIDWGNARLQARGMHLNLLSGTLILDADGHGTLVY